MSYNFLIVDDSTTTRTIIKKILEISNISIGEIYEAGDGEEALNLLQSNWIDMIFADINMPKMDGIEMVNKMSENELLKYIPVVIVSSDGSELRIKELMSKGVRAYLKKPFTPENIKEIVYNIFEQGGKENE